MDSWNEITAKIRANSWREDNGKPDAVLSKLLRDRRAILELANGKLAKLSSLLELEDLKALKHTLIYTTDKGPAQIEQVNRMLGSKDIRYHQLTEEETRNRRRVRQILESFRSTDIQVLTAKRVLDEGVNIPEISKAFILASTTVERQWIQRRGRLLRTCEAIGKTHSVIHDFLVLPPEWKKGLDRDTKSLVSSELKRTLEFAKLSRNAGRPDGAMRVIDGLLDMVHG
jgi:superfamily II DNA or RNA helicase